MSEQNEYIYKQLRKGKVCIACGFDKPVGNIVCWDCFKYRDNCFKDSTLNLEDWLKEMN